MKLKLILQILIMSFFPYSLYAAKPVADSQSVSFSVDTTNNVITLTGHGTPAITTWNVPVTGPSHGTLTAFGTPTSTSATYHYTPTHGYIGPDSFTFTVTNNAGNSPAATVTITINDVAPTANAQSVSFSVNSTNNAIQLTGTDLGGETLTFTKGTGPSHGILPIFNTTTGAVTYTPTSGYIGSDSFTFTVTNTSSQTSAAAIVSITVTDLPPTATPQSVSFVINTTNNVITLTGTDPGSAALTFTAPSTTTHGTLTAFGTPTSTSATYHYTPTSGYFGSDPFTFTVTNTSSQTSSAATVSVTVTDVAPTANAQSVSCVVNSSNNIITLTGTDVGSSALTFNVPGTTVSGRTLTFINNPTSSSARYYYTPTPSSIVSDSFAFTVTNTSSQTSTPATVSITVTDLPPTATPQSVSFVINSVGNAIQLAGTDPGNSALTFARGTGPSHGTLPIFNTTTGAVTYTPTSGYFGSDTFTFTVTNTSSQTSSLATVSVTVTDVAPTANAQSVSCVVNSSNNIITLTGTDVGSSALIFAITTPQSHGTLTFINNPTSSSARYYYTPTPSSIVSDSFAFTVTNTSAQTSSPATVSITVTDLPPTATPQSVSCVINTTNNVITLQGTDPGNSALTFTVPGTTTHGALTFINKPTSSSARYYYTPTSGYFGSDPFTFTVTNSSSQTSSQAAVSVTVTDVAPTANAQSVSYVINSSNNIITLTGTDVGSSALTFAITSAQSHGTLTFINNPTSSSARYYYTPTATYFGADSFAFTVTNTSTQTSSPATVSITVTDLAPTATPQSVSFVINSVGNAIQLAGTDPGNSALTFARGTGPSHGTLPTFNTTTGAVTYTPTSGYF